MQILCGGIVLILIASVLLFANGQDFAASTLSGFGTLVWMFGVLIYVVVWDSRKRWPNQPLSKRLTAVMTFQRHP